jgi:hypothetical protein
MASAEPSFFPSPLKETLCYKVLCARGPALRRASGGVLVLHQVKRGWQLMPSSPGLLNGVRLPN